MKQSPWDASSRSDSHTFMNFKLYYCVQKRPPLVPILSHTSPVLSITPCFFKIHFYMVVLSTCRSSRWPLSFRFFDRKLCTYFLTLPWLLRVPRSSLSFI
jgi:hypothetical protein